MERINLNLYFCEAWWSPEVPYFVSPHFNTEERQTTVLVRKRYARKTYYECIFKPNHR